MKKLFSFLFIFNLSAVVVAQEAPTASEASEGKNYTKKYFISTNSGVKSTPVGLRIGFLDKRGAYLGARFGSGYSYKVDGSINRKWVVSKGTLFSTTIGLIFPLYHRGANFNAHAYTGIGYGQWFNRAPKNGQKVGFESEAGFIISYSKIMMTFGGNFLVGDGKAPKTDLSVGLGYRIY